MAAKIIVIIEDQDFRFGKLLFHEVGRSQPAHPGADDDKVITLANVGCFLECRAIPNSMGCFE